MQHFVKNNKTDWASQACKSAEAEVGTTTHDKHLTKFRQEIPSEEMKTNRHDMYVTFRPKTHKPQSILIQKVRLAVLKLDFMHVQMSSLETPHVNFISSFEERY